jgi:hypothetical protein
MQKVLAAGQIGCDFGPLPSSTLRLQQNRCRYSPKK